MRKCCFCFLILILQISFVWAGPYCEGGIAGYIGTDLRPTDPNTDPNAVINPVFKAWAFDFENYLPSDDEDDWWGGVFDDPHKALGPATGNYMDIVSLGDLDSDELSSHVPPGEITLKFGLSLDPNDLPISDGNGYDFAIFENGFVSMYTKPSGSISGQMLAELAFVEVSSDGINFARFPSVSLTASAVGAYGTIEISNIYNLAGKHPNANGICFGTGFDLACLANNPLVISGTVNLNDIRYVKIIDIPGSGDFLDSAAGNFIDFLSYPYWDYYVLDHPVYDAWLTWGSGGFDLDAVGVLYPQDYSADINTDGIVDFVDLSMFLWSWGSSFGQYEWNPRCDLFEDLVIDIYDLEVFSEQWLCAEDWRN